MVHMTLMRSGGSFALRAFKRISSSVVWYGTMGMAPVEHTLEERLKAPIV